MGLTAEVLDGCEVREPDFVYGACHSGRKDVARVVSDDDVRAASAWAMEKYIGAYRRLAEYDSN